MTLWRKPIGYQTLGEACAAPKRKYEKRPRGAAPNPSGVRCRMGQHGNCERKPGRCACGCHGEPD